MHNLFPQSLPDGPEGMDLHPYLVTWSNLAPRICKHIQDDIWQFTFSGKKIVECDVVSFHGTGMVEDLVKEEIAQRAGWLYAITYDRVSESFSAQVTIPSNHSYAGHVSLNPSIALLSAYLHALQG